MIETELNYSLIEIERNKIGYLEGLIISLKNTMSNLANLYNFNLWRKLFLCAIFRGSHLFSSGIWVLPIHTE